MHKKDNNLIPIYHSVEEVFDKLRPAYNKTFSHFDVNNRLENTKNKGRLGQIVEEGILGYPINSDPKADLANLGIEIKTTGVIAKKNGVVIAKERLAIDSINYKKIVDFSFEQSPVWEKTNSILFVFYKYIAGEEYGNMPIIKAALNSFSDEDKKILKRDYETIIGKIMAGKAEEISEGDTMYLGACTAGEGKGKLVEQPFSNVGAKPRKFCLKQPYFSELIRKYISPKEFEHAADPSIIESLGFEMAIESKLNQYKGLAEEQIRNQFSITASENAKNRYERYAAAMLGIKGAISETEEFRKAGIEVKTIRIQKNKKIKESMSFPYFDFNELVTQDWETSELREMFTTKKFMFVVFKEYDDGMHFEKIKFWHMSEQDLDNIVRPVFEKTKEILLNGSIVNKLTRNKKGKIVRKTNFPGMSENEMVHVRPHGQNADDVCELPVPDKLTGATEYTKQCFWLNNSFVLKIINSD